MTDSLQKKKILVIEDDDAFNLWIGIVLKRLGIEEYKRVREVEDALKLLDNELPDLIISDIFLEGKLTGVDLLKKSYKHSIPTIITTSSTSEELYREIQQIENVIYLVKPFQPLTLIASIESLMFGGFNDAKVDKLRAPSIFVKLANNKNTKVYLSDIVFLESDGNYTYIHTKDKKMALKKSMAKVLSELDESFIQCHRTFCVNKIHINSWSTREVRVGDRDIPIGRSFLKLLERELRDQ